MTAVGVHEARTHLSRLLHRVAAGEETEITNRGTVVARLVGPPRDVPRPGYDRGRIRVAADFDAPLPDELQAVPTGEAAARHPRVLLAAAGPELLGAAAALLEDAEERWLSAASTWEMAIKSGLGKLALGMSAGAWTARAVVELGLRTLGVTTRHAAAVEALPSHHRDPFDRLLVAQAQAEGLVLLTADPLLAAYGGAVHLVG